jgi:hypothetical protein
VYEAAEVAKEVAVPVAAEAAVLAASYSENEQRTD